MQVPQEEMYERLKDYTWTFKGAEYDLYSTVDIDENDNLTFLLNRMEFTLSRFAIRGNTAKIHASCNDPKMPVEFTFTGARVPGIQ